jgi:hypothetical protein
MRKRATSCRICGKAREEGSRFALCERHRQQAQRRYAKTWRDNNPDKAKAIWDRHNALRPRKGGGKR